MPNPSDNNLPLTQSRRLPAASSSDFIASLTASYLVALVVLALLSVGGYIVINNAIETEARFAARINESGRMRAFLWQVAFQADQLIQAETDAGRDASRANLRATLNDMEDLHSDILYGSEALGLLPLRNEAHLDLYFYPPMRLDARTRAFIAEARALANQPDSALNAENSHYRYVINQANGDLFEYMDQAVTHYHKFSRAEVERHRQQELGLMLAMLSVLGIEAILIFNPMVRRVAADRKRLSSEVAERQRVAGLEHMQRTLAEALRDTASALTGSLELEEVLDQILENVGRVVPHEAGNIMLIEGDHALVVRVRGYDEPNRLNQTMLLRFNIADTPNLREMIAKREPIIIPNVREYAGWIDLPSTLWIHSHIGIPVFSKDQPVGFISLDSSQINAFADVNPEWLKAFADQAAVAIQNARLYDGMRRSADELRRRAKQELVIAWLGQRALSGTALDDLMSETCAVVVNTLDVETCSLFEWQPERSEFVLRAGLGLPPEMIGTLRIGNRGQAGYSLQTGDPVIVAQFSTEQRFEIHPMYGEYGIESSVSVLVPGRTIPFGVLGVGSKQPSAFTSEHAGFLQALANILAAAIDRKRAEVQLEQSFEKTQELYEISRLIGLVRAPEDILRALLIAKPLTYVSRAAFLIFDHFWTADAVPEQLEVVAAWHPDGSPTQNVGERFPIEEFGFVNLFTREHPVVISDIETDTKISQPIRDNLSRMGTRSMIAFPLIASGNWYGVLGIHSRQAAELTDDDARHLHGLVDQAAVALNGLLLLRTEAAARRAAEKADELKLKFLAMISHELRTPLTSIKGFATTLLAPDVTWDAQTQHDFINIINEEADKLADLIEQLLDLSRLEAGTLSIEAKDVPIMVIMETAMPQLSVLTASHQLNMSISPELPPVHADPRRISQVICNLVNNAVKYSPPHSTIFISAHPHEQELCIEITDQGHGIPADERETIFQPFRQASNRSQRETKGAGLGLAIARALIDAHNGRIWVKDSSEQGTTICFTVPRAPLN